MKLAITASPAAALLNAALQSIDDLVPVEVGKPDLVQAPLLQTDFGVLIGILGSLKGRLLILGEEEVFTKAGLAMYGLEPSGEMLESFVGEFGNSVAVHAATKLSKEGLAIDITPPTTMRGRVHLGGFKSAIQVPFLMNRGEQGQFVLAIEDG